MAWAAEPVRKSPGTFATGSHSTNAPIPDRIPETRTGDGQPRGYVGSLPFNRQPPYEGRALGAAERAAEVGPGSREPVQGGAKERWPVRR